MSYFHFGDAMKRKTTRFAFKMTPQDRLALAQLVEVENEQASVIIRRLIRQAVQRLDALAAQQEPSYSDKQQSSIRNGQEL